RSIIGDAQRGVIRQPDIQIKPILDIVGKELGFKPGTKETADHQENQGPAEDSPTVFYGFADKPIIEAVKSSLPSLLNRRFRLCRRTQNVVPQEGNKRHGNDQRTN